MNFLTIISITVLICFAKADLSDDWSNWKNVNKKGFTDQAKETLRRGVFEYNLNQIKQHNSKNLSFKMALNKFSDLTDEEMKAKYTVHLDENKVKTFVQKANLSVPKLASKVAVDTVNWVTAGYVSPVRDQGSCGSCYAFSAAAATESAYAIKRSLKNACPVLSPQQILDCSYYKYISNGVIGNLGCNGGYSFFAFYYQYLNGLQLDSSYPYVGFTKSCAYASSKVVARVTGIWTASNLVGDFNSIKYYVLRQPVVVYMYVTSDFYKYSSGIYTGPNCMSQAKSCPLGINHAVLIVGYGIDNGTPYWVVKNSWGTSWGQKGYFYIAMGRNTCCIEGYSYFPSVQ